MQKSMFIGGLFGLIGLGVAEVHSPERNGKCCAEQTAAAMRASKQSAGHFERVMSADPLFFMIRFLEDHDSRLPVRNAFVNRKNENRTGREFKKVPC